MLRLENKVAVITGGSNGLGAAIATRMTEEGAAVMVLDIDTKNGEALVAELKKRNYSAAFEQCDVTNEDVVAQSLNKAVTEFGRLDVVVNNAGVEGPNRTTAEYELADWNRVFALNTTAVFLCTKHAVPLLKQTGGGSIVNISSIYGLVGGGDVAAYHASKGAIRTMSKNDAITFAPNRIRVNSIYPGFIPTAMVHRFADDSGMQMQEAQPMLDEMHPLGGMGTPDDVAWGVVYLASDQARWVTGTELVIDGGYTSR